MGRDWSDMVGVGRILAAAGGSARARDERKESLKKEKGRKRNERGSAVHLRLHVLLIAREGGVLFSYAYLPCVSVACVRVLRCNGTRGITGKCFIKSRGNVVFSPFT